MKHRFTLAAFVAAAMLAACGGGGSSGGGGGTVPSPTGTPAATGNIPLTEAVGSAPAWVNPSNHKTLYFLDDDTATGGTCVAACLSVWPPLTPTVSTGDQNMTIITRSDGTGTQWAYHGHPLYNFSGDNGPDQANGDNFAEPNGGHWHVARPAAATPPPGGSTPPPCVGTYC